MASLPETPWFLYMIECEDGSIYTGIATNVESRFQAHASGKGAKYTRAHKPRELLLAVRYPNRSIASKAEYEFRFFVKFAGIFSCYYNISSFPQ